MSTAATLKILAIVGIAMLLAGCAPATGLKSLLALGVTLVSFGAAAWGLAHDRHEDRVAAKANALDQKVTAHVEKYHNSKG